MARQVKNPKHPEQTDYIKPGSAQHAQFLKLRKAEEHDTIVVDGFALADIESLGPAATPDYMRAILASRVRELHGSHPELQSENPRSGNYAQPMWSPAQGSIE